MQPSSLTWIVYSHCLPQPELFQAAPSVARGGNVNGNTNPRDDRKLQLLLLHSAFPRADEDAERFALRGNFTTEAVAINKLEVRHGTAASLANSAVFARFRATSSTFLALVHLQADVCFALIDLVFFLLRACFLVRDDQVDTLRTVVCLLLSSSRFVPPCFNMCVRCAIVGLAVTGNQSGGS